jgi:hypothetical protein
VLLERFDGTSPSQLIICLGVSKRLRSRISATSVEAALKVSPSRGKRNTLVCDTGAAYRFLRKTLRAVSDYPPSSITTDTLASYSKAIRRLLAERRAAAAGCRTPHLEISE